MPDLFDNNNITGWGPTLYARRPDITMAMVDAFLNKPNFPTTELKPGQDFHSTTIFRFARDASLPPMSR